MISGDPALTGFADFAVAYAKYCDGGSFSGTMTTPDVASTARARCTTQAR